MKLISIDQVQEKLKFRHNTSSFQHFFLILKANCKCNKMAEPIFLGKQNERDLNGLRLDIQILQVLKKLIFCVMKSKLKGLAKISILEIFDTKIL